MKRRRRREEDVNGGGKDGDCRRGYKDFNGSKGNRGDVNLEEEWERGEQRPTVELDK